MILAVDIGNTTVRTCGIDSDEARALRFSVRSDTAHGMTADGYRAQLLKLLKSNGADPAEIEGAVICSVVPELTAPIQSCLNIMIGKKPVTVSSRCVMPLKMNVPAPERVGADRIADSVSAAAYYPLPAVTVDMGTATTFNVIAKGGVFLGGVIAPGTETGIKALADGTAALYAPRLREPKNAIGRDTEECMISGAAIGAASLIDEMTLRIEKELGSPVTLVITGGLAEYAEPLLRHSHIRDPDLLPKGMALIYKLNHI